MMLDLPIIGFVLLTLAVALGNFISQVAWIKIGKQVIKKLSELIPDGDEDETPA